MTDGEALPRAVIARPDDDTPRLVYADWLDENGRPDRAAFVRVQVELSRLPEGDPRRVPLEARQGDLLSAFGPVWVEEDGYTVGPGGNALFDRGFVTELSLRGAGLGDADVEALARNPCVGLLAVLDLGDNRVTETGLRALAGSAFLGGLRLLDLRDNDLSADRFAPMGRWPRVLQVQGLYGQAPVQADGRVGEHPFYFRARWQHWTFGLSEDGGVDPTDVYADGDGRFARGEDWGDSAYAASYMPHDEALAFIRRCAGEYLVSRGLG